jgi:hypothetical protein
VAFFAWSTALGKILITDNLRKRRIIVVNWCCMYKKRRESVDHLLLHCEVASALWNFGLAWDMPRQAVYLFACWRCQFNSSHSSPLRKMISSCIMWCIRRESNDRRFEDCERTVVELQAFFFNTLYHWATAYDYFPISEFLSLCSFSSKVFLLYISCVLGLRPYVFFLLMKFNYL